MEAMGSGLPVVSTNLPTGMRAINRDGETGLVVPPCDGAALASALNSLLADPALRARMGDAARRRATELFSREMMGARLLELYGAICRPEGVMSWST